MNDGPAQVPGEIAADTTEEEPLLGEETLIRGVSNGDLSAYQVDPTAVAPTSDPAPDDIDADFPGVPLSEAEIQALPLEEAGAS